MSKFIIGRKLGMSQTWNDKHEVEPITLLDCSNVSVIGERTIVKDCYKAVILGIPKKNNSKTDFALISEFRTPEGETGYKIGETLNVDAFSSADRIKAVGISKGKGFQGVVKRHNFSGGPKTHGHRHVLRSGGSIGSAFPEHVLKGRKMAGRMGDSRVTVKNLKVAWVDKEKNILAIKGAVPGKKGAWVKIIEI